MKCKAFPLCPLCPSMFRAAVKLLLCDVRFQQVPSNPAAAEAGPPPQSGAGGGGRRMSGPVTRLGLRPSADLRSSRGSGCEPGRGDPVLAFYPSARGSRGPQRLCSLSPDTSAAAPSPWRSRETTRHTTVRAARVRRIDDPPDLRAFQDRARGDDAGRDIPPTAQSRACAPAPQSQSGAPASRFRTARGTTA